jgi:hypothetical protein
MAKKCSNKKYSFYKNDKCKLFEPEYEFELWAEDFRDNNTCGWIDKDKEGE